MSKCTQGCLFTCVKKTQKKSPNIFRPPPSHWSCWSTPHEAFGNHLLSCQKVAPHPGRPNEKFTENPSNFGVSKNRETPQNGWLKWWKTLLIHGWFGGTIIFGNTQFFVTFLGWLKRDPKSDGFLWPPTFGDLKRSRLESPGESIHPNVLESKKSGGVDITKFEKRRHFKSWIFDSKESLTRPTETDPVQPEYLIAASSCNLLGGVYPGKVLFIFWWIDFFS